MKMLLVSTRDTGGAGIACVRLHQALLEQGIQAKLLLLNKSNQAVSESYAFYENARLLSYGKKVAKRLMPWHYALWGKPKGYEPFSTPFSLHRIHLHPLYQWADVINLHWSVLFLDYSSFFQCNQKPIIWTLHDLFPLSGGYHYRSGFPFDAYQTLIQRYTHLKRHSISGQNVTVVSPSHWLKAESEQSQILRCFKQVVIPNGLDSNVFKQLDEVAARRVFHLPKDKKVLLFVATSLTNKRKGYGLLHEAIKQIPNKEQLTLLMLGKHSVHYPDIETCTLGFVTEEKELATAYAAASLFIMPSIEDNLPNTVIESLMCGTPVVGFRVGGIPDMVIHGKNGVLCDKIDAEHLSVAITQALNMNFDRAWIRADARQRFDKKIQADKYIDLLNSMQYEGIVTEYEAI